MKQTNWAIVQMACITSKILQKPMIERVLFFDSIFVSPQKKLSKWVYLSRRLFPFRSQVTRGNRYNARSDCNQQPLLWLCWLWHFFVTWENKNTIVQQYQIGWMNAGSKWFCMFRGNRHKNWTHSDFSILSITIRMNPFGITLACVKKGNPEQVVVMMHPRIEMRCY